MGNHEYCVACGASDFHDGEPCDPVRKAAHDAEREAVREYNKRREVATERLAVELAALGYDCQVGLYCVEVRPVVT